MYLNVKRYVRAASPARFAYGNWSFFLSFYMNFTSAHQSNHTVFKSRCASTYAIDIILIWMCTATVVPYSERKERSHSVDSTQTLINEIDNYEIIAVDKSEKCSNYFEFIMNFSVDLSWISAWIQSGRCWHMSIAFVALQIDLPNFSSACHHRLLNSQPNAIYCCANHKAMTMEQLPV